jgi:hypothetical protein
VPIRKLLVGLMLASIAASAHASRKDCDELRAQIEAKLHKRGVQGFSLDIVEAGDTGSARVVGNCDHGKYRIVYARGGGRPTPDVPKKTAPAPKKKSAKKASQPKKKKNSSTKPAPVPAIGNY